MAQANVVSANSQGHKKATAQIDASPLDTTGFTPSIATRITAVDSLHLPSRSCVAMHFGRTVLVLAHTALHHAEAEK
jgi:hypothetical protein